MNPKAILWGAMGVCLVALHFYSETRGQKDNVAMIFGIIFLCGAMLA